MIQLPLRFVGPLKPPPKYGVLDASWTLTKAESQSRQSVNFPTHSAVLSHDGLGNRCKKWARACQAGAPPRAASLIGVHAANLVHFLLRYSRKNESTSEALSPPYINQSSSQATLHSRYQY